MSQPLTTNSPIIKNLFGALGSGWSTQTLTIVLNDINGSPTLLSELSGMQISGTSIWWSYTDQEANPGTRDYYISGSNPTKYNTSIAPEVLSGVFPNTLGNAVDNLLITIAYEAGHAEDRQFYIQNGNGYLQPYFVAQNGGTPGSDLQFGAEVALQLLGEGKSLYNAETIATQIPGLLSYVPYDPNSTVLALGRTDPTQAILYGAGVAGLGTFSGYSTTVLPTLLLGYWTLEVDPFLETASSPNIKTVYSPQFYNDISDITDSDVASATNLLFDQNPDGSDSMTIDFGEGTVSSYVIDFGGYGPIDPDGIFTTQPSNSQQPLTPTSSTETTYQEFMFTNGHEDWFIDSAAGGTIAIGGTASSGTVTPYIFTLDAGDQLSFKYAHMQNNGITQGTFALPTLASTLGGDGLLTAFTTANSTIAVTASNEMLLAAGSNATYILNANSLTSGPLTKVSLIDADSTGGTLNLTGTSLVVTPDQTFTKENSADFITITSGSLAINTTLTASNLVEINATSSQTSVLNLAKNSGIYGEYEITQSTGGFLLNSENAIGHGSLGGIPGFSLSGFQDIVLGNRLPFLFDVAFAGEGSVGISPSSMHALRRDHPADDPKRPIVLRFFSTWWRYYKPSVLLRVHFVAVVVAIMFTAYAAQAQPVVAPPFPRTPQASVHQVPSYCQRSTLTGVEFLELIHSIIAHGDLTDIPFLEKTLGTKFSSSYGYPAQETPDKQILQLNSEQTLGNPIPVHITIYYAKSEQLMMHQIAGLGFGDQSTFITDCFHFSPSDISSYFGGGFYRKVIFNSPIYIYYQENRSLGKNGSKIYIAFSDGVENNLVDYIGFSQIP